jgi:cytidylate kinase
MYRALAYKVLALGLNPEDSAAAEDVLNGTCLEFSSDSVQSILLDGREVGGLIRTPEVGEAASSLSTHSAVREWLVAQQQLIISDGGVILEGRDATTVVAPNADLKIFLTASLEERAKRRMQEFREKGLEDDFEQVRAQIESRDHRDITRAVSPLKVDTNAVVIESGMRSIEEICEQIKTLLKEATS